MEIALTKMSSKGQIVIPSELRGKMHKGDLFIIIRSGDQIVLKMAKKFSKQLKEDLIFARRTEEAYRRDEKGQFKSLPADEFLKELKTW